MYAQCPECLTFFHLKPSHLKAANGRVRCSRCKHVFNALETLRDELSAEEIAAVEAARKREPKSDAPLLSEEYAGDLFDALEYTQNEELGLDDEPDHDAVLGKATGSPSGTVPLSITRPRDFAAPPASPRRRLLFGAANVLLLLLLALQLVHWQRFEILEHPLAGPYLARAYDALGISREPPRDLAALNVSRTEVASHPEHRQALYLTALLQNTGERAQPWPELHVVLQDRWGETVAARYFEAAEYLREPEKARDALDAGTRHAIELAVLDPGSKAVGFQVEPCFARRVNGETRHVCTGDLEVQR